jgi:hypothetical protein
MSPTLKIQVNLPQLPPAIPILNHTSSRAHFFICQTIIQITPPRPPAIQKVIRSRDPRTPILTLGKLRNLTLNIRARQGASQFVLPLRISSTHLWNNTRVPVVVHALDDADEKTDGEVAAQRPAVVPVADDVAEIRDRGEHGKAPEVF